MHPTDFTAAQHLRFTGQPFEAPALAAWVADCWPLIEDAPDVDVWAAEFQASQLQQLVEGVAAGMTVPG